MAGLICGTCGKVFKTFKGKNVHEAEQHPPATEYRQERDGLWYSRTPAIRPDWGGGWDSRATAQRAMHLVYNVE